MPLTPEQLDNWFTYHPPTPDTAPKYAAIRAAEDRAHAVLLDLHYRVHHSGSPIPILAEDCDQVNSVMRAFAEAIDENAPDSADKAAAIRCVRLARNAANEFVMSNVHHASTRCDTAGLSSAELVKARWQANSAIACGGK